jgi:hypothetical protein
MTVVPLRQPSAADRLETLARQPLQPRRELLLDLVARLRALEGLDHEVLHHGEHGQQQLTFEEAA